MPYRYIYEIVNTANGHTYVGQRTSTCLPAVDVYWGPGVLIKVVRDTNLNGTKKAVVAYIDPRSNETMASITVKTEIIG